jgi:hypothetical protein
MNNPALKRWCDLSEDALNVMKELGEFTPTVHTQSREVKGVRDSDKCYLDSRDLRRIALACVEVADWLDLRAEIETL